MILSWTFVHTVQVKTKTGNGFDGETWSGPVSVQCWVEDSTNDIRANDGTTTTSSARLFAPLGERSAFPVGSDVVLPSGRTAQVIKVGVFDSGTLQLGLDHIEVDLTQMPSSVELTLTPVDVDTAAARAVKRAGVAILALSDAGAPTEPVPRHGVHMTETGFAKVIEAGVGGATVEIGYEAWWATRQHEDLEYHHPHGGTAKFLELAMIEGKDAAFALMASDVAQALGE